MENFSNSFALYTMRNCDPRFREIFESHEGLFLVQAQRKALDLEIYLGILILYYRGTITV